MQDMQKMFIVCNLSSHDALEGLPHVQAAGACVKGAHIGVRGSRFSLLWRKQRCWLLFSTSAVVFIVQERMASDVVTQLLPLTLLVGPLCSTW